jgi:hypothetical protein
VERGRLRNDAGFVTYQGISEFDAIHLARTGQRGEVVRRFRRAARAGRNAVRVLGMAKFLFELAPSMPGYLDALDFVLELAASLGLYVELVVFADAQEVMPDAGDRVRWLEQLATRYRADVRIFWQVANEPFKNGWHDADDEALLGLADVLAGILGHRDFSIGDPQDGDDEAATARMLAAFEAIGRRSNVLVLHASRKEESGRVRWVEHLKGFRDVVDVTSGKVGRELYGIHDEPMGAAAERAPGKRDNRGAAFVAAASTCAVLGLGYTYHYIAQQSDATPGLDAAAVARLIPGSPDFEYVNANLDGSWVGKVDGYEKIRPCDNGREGYAVGVGFTRGRLNVVDGWRATQLLDLESDGVVVTVWKGTRG